MDRGVVLLSPANVYPLTHTDRLSLVLAFSEGSSCQEGRSSEWSKGAVRLSEAKTGIDDELDEDTPPKTYRTESLTIEQ